MESTLHLVLRLRGGGAYFITLINLRNDETTDKVENGDVATFKIDDVLNMIVNRYKVRKEDLWIFHNEKDKEILDKSKSFADLGI